MASFAMTVGSTIVNALAFSGSSYLFSQLKDDNQDAMKKLQEKRDAWTKERTERIDYINEQLKKQGHAEQTFQSVEAAMQEYYVVTGDDLPPLSDYPQLEDFLDDDQNIALQRIELALILAGLSITGYLTYKFI